MVIGCEPGVAAQRASWRGGHGTLNRTGPSGTTSCAAAGTIIVGEGALTDDALGH
jgi:hypothetical protein